MIKIFGKIRYHWQPELSWFTIYWSIAISPFFIALSLLYEQVSLPFYFFSLVLWSLIMISLGCHRYFIIDDSEISVVSVTPFQSYRMKIADIKKVEVTKTTLQFDFGTKKSPIFQMRKWTKKYFLNALVLQEAFKGEVELLDSMIKVDYFDYYYKKPKKSPKW